MTNPPDALVRAMHIERPTGLICANVVVLCLFKVIQLFIMPVFAPMFADFGARLPAPTQFLIDASARESLLSLALSVGLCSAVVLVLVLVGVGRIAWPWLKLLLLAQGLLLLAVVVSLFLPVFQLGAVAAGLD